jgi:CheY-like chemotaxis protein
MGGNLELKSQKHKGSTFSFELQFKKCVQKDILTSETMSNSGIFLCKSEDDKSDMIASKLFNWKIDYLSSDIKNIDRSQKFSIAIAFEVSYLEQLLEQCDYVILLDCGENISNSRVKVLDINRPSSIYTTVAECKAGKQSTSKEIDAKESYSLRVLVAEDNNVNRKLIDIVLKKMGINADFASDGAKAVKMCDESEYDLILMDINMPIMCGIEATKLIKNRYKDIPIVALTANAIEGDREKFISDGMDDYLTKPLNKNELLRVLKKYSNHLPNQ